MLVQMSALAPTRSSPEFRRLLSGFDLDDLETNECAVYGVHADWTLGYLSPAWFRFATQNGGADIPTRWGLGANVLDVCGPLRSFYEENFRRCLEQELTWEHDYECSSAHEFRRFHLLVYPLQRGGGLLLVNNLVVEHAHDPVARPTWEPLQKRYRQPSGLVVQCCHCRRVQRAGNGEWDWVPAWVDRAPVNVTGGLCKPCYQVHYRAAAGA